MRRKTRREWSREIEEEKKVVSLSLDVLKEYKFTRRDEPRVDATSRQNGRTRILEMVVSLANGNFTNIERISYERFCCGG